MKKRWVHLTRDTAAAATATAEESNKGIGQIKESEFLLQQNYI